MIDELKAQLDDVCKASAVKNKATLAGNDVKGIHSSMRTPVSRLQTMERTTTTACNKITAASATTARSGRRPGESIRYVANICIQTILPGNSRPWIIPCERCKNGEKKSSLYQYPRLFNGVT